METIEPDKRIADTELQQEIKSILKNSDLEITTTNNVVQMLEEKFGTNLSERKEIIHEMVIDCGNNLSSSNSEEENEEIVDSEKTLSKKKSKTRTRVTRGGSNKESKSTTKKSSTKAKKEGVKKRGKKPGGYTKAYKLSPELSELVGATELPRHEVVRRVWAMIKEKQLMDPINRQFAICDKSLYSVFGVERFHTFGMMKHLKRHFIAN